VNKKIEDIKVVVCGVGAAGFTCARYFLSLGVKRENLLGVDIKGKKNTSRLFDFS